MGITSIDVPQPPETETAIFTGSDMSMERDAQLLVTGSWPDKSLTITEADLDGIVARFSADTIPIKTEHVDSPLDPLGLVKSVWRVGNKLMGKLVFPADLHGFLQRRGVSKLSVGLNREPVSLAEVSLVLKPRVASAALLSDEGGGGNAPDKDRVELAALRAELRREIVDGQIADLKRAGRLVPAAEPMARALLSVEGAALVTLSDGTTAPVAATALRLLHALPRLVTFAETAGGGAQTLDADAPLTADQENWLQRTLGVDPAQVRAEIARTIAAGQGGPSGRSDSYRTGGAP